MKTNCLISFLGGAAVGTLVALLMAPDSGSNTRKKLSKKFKEGKRKVENAIERKASEGQEY